MGVLWSVGVAVLAATEVSLQVAAPVPCVSAPSLRARLAQAGHRVDTTGVPVRVRTRDRDVEVLVERQGSTLTRRIPTEGEDCAVVERLVVSLVVSWLDQLPAPPPAKRAEPPRAHEPRAPPPAVAPAPTSETVEATPTESANPTEPQPPAEPEPVAESPPAERQPLAITRETRVVVPETPAPLSLGLRLLGGAANGPTTSVTAAGSLEATLSYGRWGGQVDVGLESVRAATVVTSRIDTAMQWLTLSARVEGRPLDWLTLDAALGVRGWRISATAVNVVDPRPLELFVVGGALAVGASARLVGPLRAHLRLVLSARPQEERFDLAGYGTALTLAPWQGCALLGLEWRALGQ